MGDWFTLATWPLSKGDEVTWKHFEDVRRGIFLLIKQLGSKFNLAAYSGGYPYSLGEKCTYDGIVWISTQNNNQGHTPSTSSSYWYQGTDYKYSHFGINTNKKVIADCATCQDTEWFNSYEMLPRHLDATCNTAGSQWQSGQSIKKGDIRWKLDSQLIQWTYTAKSDHVSDSGNTPPNATYWSLYKNHIEVTVPTISNAIIDGEPTPTIGTMYEDTNVSGEGHYVTSYGIGGGRPPSSGNPLHAEQKFYEYQAHIERMGELNFWELTAGFSRFGTGYRKYAPMTDWRFDCNKSGFELALKKSGSWHWWYDTSYYPKYWHWAGGGFWAQSNCPICNTQDHGGGVWRRTWTTSMAELPYLREQDEISSPHDAAPTTRMYPNPTGDAREQRLYKAHNLNVWHGNAWAVTLNQMKAVLSEYKYTSWPLSIGSYDNEFLQTMTPYQTVWHPTQTGAEHFAIESLEESIWQDMNGSLAGFCQAGQTVGWMEWHSPNNYFTIYQPIGGDSYDGNMNKWKYEIAYLSKPAGAYTQQEIEFFAYAEEEAYEFGNGNSKGKWIYMSLKSTGFFAGTISITDMNGVYSPIVGSPTFDTTVEIIIEPNSLDDLAGPAVGVDYSGFPDDEGGYSYCGGRSAFVIDDKAILTFDFANMSLEG